MKQHSNSTQDTNAKAARPKVIRSRPSPPYSLLQRLLAEALGTFGLIFAALGAIAMDGFSDGAVGHGGISAAFGLVVMAMIYIFGAVSGAHINPAVTIGFALSGRLPQREVLPYIAAQTVGGVIGGLMLLLLFTEGPQAGMTLPKVGIWQTLILETLLTTALMLLILRVSSGAREEGLTAAIAIGAYVGLAALWAGPACGASMNPVRSFVPALMSMNFAELWIYLLAPLVGAGLAVALDRALTPQPQIKHS